MNRRARSQEAKLRRAEELLEAARRVAAQRGGVRHVTLAAVTEAVGLHPSAVRRYFDSREELLLELAERGWRQWCDNLVARLSEARCLTPEESATAISGTIARHPLLCDLLTHVPLSVEGAVTADRARRFETHWSEAFDTMVKALTTTGSLTVEQAEDLVAAAVCLTAHLWQIAHPTPALAELFARQPHWRHLALDFEARLARSLQAIARGLTQRAA
jgi:AcrR family transcriptional regulator